MRPEFCSASCLSLSTSASRVAFSLRSSLVRPWSPCTFWEALSSSQTLSWASRHSSERWRSFSSAARSSC
uniref:Putative secreted protein n=1 Tax=Ixodes ricinus TaxID=34613 RepID=A0A6B0U2K3_IXORI